MNVRTNRAGSGWPHVILQREPHNRRFEIKVGNVITPELVRPAAFAFFQTGAVDRKGLLTPAGQALVLESVRAKALEIRAVACIVWGPRRCTWLGIEDVEGDDPPFGEPGDSGDWRHLHAVTIPGSWIALPDTCSTSHIFIRRLTHDRVEISSARPMVVGRWDEPPRSDETDPFEGCFGPDGSFDPPRRHRGVEVSATEDGRILGPIQPDGRDSVVTAPWPHLVLDACTRIARVPLPNYLTSTVWRAVAADQAHRVTTEVRQAA